MLAQHQLMPFHLAGLLKSRAKPRHGEFSHAEVACDLLICENARGILRGIGCLCSTTTFTVCVDSQFNGWLMLGWQSSSIFSLLSSGLCLGKITWGAEHRDCRVFLCKASDRNTAAVQPSLLTQLCPAQEPGTAGPITQTQFALFCPGLNLKTVRTWELKSKK